MNKLVIDLSNLQEADDGDTTHYGGFISINGSEVRASGTDRQLGLPQHEAIELALTVLLGIYGEDDLNNIRCMIDGQGAGGVATVTKVGNEIHVYSDHNGLDTYELQGE